MEDLSVEFPRTPYPGHLSERGYNGVYFVGGYLHGGVIRHYGDAASGQVQAQCPWPWLLIVLSEGLQPSSLPDAHLHNARPGVAHCWARNLRVINADNYLHLIRSAFCTASNVTVEERPGPGARCARCVRVHVVGGWWGCCAGAATKCTCGHVQLPPVSSGLLSPDSLPLGLLRPPTLFPSRLCAASAGAGSRGTTASTCCAARTCLSQSEW